MRGKLSMLAKLSSCMLLKDSVHNKESRTACRLPGG